MIAGIASLVLAFGMVALSLVCFRGLDAIRRGLTQCSDVLSALLTVASQGFSSEPAASSQELSSRLEAVERRVELALQDLNTQLRRLGQRRRQLLQAGEDIDPLEEQEQLELASALKSRAASPAPQQENGRPRLQRRR